MGKLKQPAHLCRHPEDNCFKKPAMPTLAEEWEKERKGETRALISEEERPTAMAAEVIHPCFMALPLSNLTTRIIQPNDNPAWILDSGCTTSMVPTADILSDYEVVINHCVQLADGTKFSQDGLSSTIANDRCTVRDADNSTIFEAAYERGLIRCNLDPVEDGMVM